MWVCEEVSGCRQSNKYYLKPYYFWQIMKPSKVNKRSRLKLGTYRGIWGVSKSKSPLTPREARAVIAIKKMYPGEHENAAFRRQLITELRDSVKDRVWHITEILRNTGTVGFSEVTWKTI